MFSPTRRASIFSIAQRNKQGVRGNAIAYLSPPKEEQTMPRPCRYRATKRDRTYLRRYRSGKSIGFTMRSSLKAKGLIPRSDGTRKISAKYCGK